MAKGPRLSGLQRQVLSLYRSALRASREKQQQGEQSIAAYARTEIEKHRAVDRKDIQLIEHLLRRGRRQLDVLSAAETTGIRLQTVPAGSSSSGGGSSGGSSSGPA